MVNSNEVDHVESDSDSIPERNQGITSRRIRQGWDDAFREMARNKDDELIDGPQSPTIFDQTEWEW